MPRVTGSWRRGVPAKLGPREAAGGHGLAVGNPAGGLGEQRDGRGEGVQEEVAEEEAEAVPRNRQPTLGDRRERHSG